MVPLAGGRPHRRRIPRAVLAATAAFVGLTAIWSVVAPLGEAPDEPDHLALVLYLADGNPYPDYDEPPQQSPSSGSAARSPRPPAGLPREGAGHPVGLDPPPPRGRGPGASVLRPAWDDEGGDEATRVDQPDAASTRRSTTQAMAVVLRVERAVTGGPASLDRELALLRLVNVLLMAAAPAARVVGGPALRARRRAGSVWRRVALGLPMLTHIGGDPQQRQPAHRCSCAC